MACNFDDIVYTSEEKKTPEIETEYRNSTYYIISKMAYLLGVPKVYFEEEQYSPKMEFFDEMNQKKEARIIRYLCMVRTYIEVNYRKIQQEITYNLKNITNLPQYVPSVAIKTLEEDGVTVFMPNHPLNDYIININKEIKNRINNCKELFPSKIDWNYIKDLFVMPDGLTESGIRKAAKEYYTNKSGYPYGVYLNWPYKNYGNILFNDKKFVTLLYTANEDRFTDFSLITDVGNVTITSIEDFLKKAKRVEMIVDCENSDPIKLHCALNSFEKNHQIDKIQKIVLYDDVHASSAWKFIKDFTNIDVEYKLLERVKDDKSYLDVTLSANAVKDFYSDLQIDSFILVSSDSDYWGLIDSLPDASFMMMVENSKTSPAIKSKLYDAGIPYCYLDKFNSGNASVIKYAAMINEIKAKLCEEITFNLQDVLLSAYESTRIDMTEGEKKQFFDRYIKPMKLCFEDNGNAYVQLGA